MNITSILSKDSLISDLKAQTKDEVIRELAQAVTKSEPAITEDELVFILQEREKLGSTGIGSGVAIPHGKISNLDHIVAGFGRSQKGIDFDSQDGEPTHLFFVLVAPENTAGLHLKALAKLSRLLKDSHFRDRLMQAADGATIYKIIAEEDEKS